MKSPWINTAKVEGASDLSELDFKSMEFSSKVRDLLPEYFDLTKAEEVGVLARVLITALAMTTVQIAEKDTQTLIDEMVKAYKRNLKAGRKLLKELSAGH